VGARVEASVTGGDGHWQSSRAEATGGVARRHSQPPFVDSLPEPPITSCPPPRLGYGVCFARMIRRLFTLLSALSLVLCVATCVLWVRSYRNQGFLERIDFLVEADRWALHKEESLHTNRGQFVYILLENRLTFQDAEKSSETVERSRRGRWCWVDSPAPSSSGRYEAEERYGGFGVTTFETVRSTGSVWSVATVSLPYWVAALITGVAPGRWTARRFRRHRHEARRAAGLCPSCSCYLRASPGRCPECGAVPAAS
jgi:hypothetical protein